MSALSRAQPVLIAAGFLLGAVLVSAPLAPLPSARAQSTSLTGQLLVATDDLKDPRFTRAVIFIIRHDADGAMGMIVNRPLGEAPLAAVLEQAGMDGTGVTGSVRMHLGGPVEALRIFVLHTPDYAGPGTVRVGNEVAVTFQRDILAAIAAGRGPKQALFTLGYAGWAPGQLDAEMKGGFWHQATSEAGIVFDDTYATKWDRAMGRRRINL
jgi:putative transcriptional regulator